jgi:hypothetical protein
MPVRERGGAIAIACPRDSGSYGHTMPDDLPHDPPLFWSVEVELPRRRSWSPRRRRRLRREIETDERIVRVLKLSALWYPALRLLVPLYPYVKVEIAAVGEGEAFRFAQGAVDAALKRIGEEGPAEPHILSTDWKEAPEDAYQAARRKHGARSKRPRT